jgi:hypothetical protein
MGGRQRGSNRADHSSRAARTRSSAISRCSPTNAASPRPSSGVTSQPHRSIVGGARKNHPMCGRPHINPTPSNNGRRPFRPGAGRLVPASEEGRERLRRGIAQAFETLARSEWPLHSLRENESAWAGGSSPGDLGSREGHTLACGYPRPGGSRHQTLRDRYRK